MRSLWIACPSFNNAEALPYHGKFFDRMFKVLLRMRGRDLHADARLALGHYGECEADDVDPLFEELRCHFHRLLFIAEHYWRDGMRRVGNGKAGLTHSAAEEARSEERRVGKECRSR